MELAPDGFRRLVELADELVAIVDESGRILYVNETTERVLGYHRRELVDKVGFDFVHPDDVADVAADFLEVLKAPGTRRQRDVRARDAEGTWRWLELVQTNRTDDPVVAGVVVSCRDVTKRKLATEFLAHQALHDPLTGLPNRVLLLDRLMQSLARAPRDERAVAVVFLDLDGFKAINDEHGHPAGDALLTAVATRLRTSLRAADTVARYGGDEFVVVAEIHPAASAVLIDRVHGVFNRPFGDAGLAFDITASGGLMIAVEGDPEELLRIADGAMYRAKANGGGHIEVALQSQ